MKKLGGIAVTGIALLLAGCSAGTADIAEKCGGESSGITERDGVLTYQNNLDASGDAWTCIVREAVPDTGEQYAIALALDDGDDGSKDYGDYTVRWATNGTTGILLEVTR